MSERAPAPEPHVFSAHRSEALADGVFAIAMTLLVIELKVPEAHSLHGTQQVAQALADLVPRFIAWALSFFVLALFWVGHHRVFSYVRRTDGPLLALSLAGLATVTLMPFSCALIGEQNELLLAQCVYSINMFLLGLTALFVARYIHRHPELCVHPMPTPAYQAARLRIGAVMLISIVAVALAALLPIPASVGNMAFMLMWLINPLSRRIERRALDASRAVERSA